MSKVTADAIIIDRAEAADLGRVTAIYAEAVASGTASYELEPPGRAEMQARYEALVSGGFPYLVARDTTGVVLGYAYAGSFRPRPAYRFIVEDSVYVAPEAKGQGIGLALMRRLIEAAQESGFRQMIAVIGDEHAQSPSVKLHEKLGFSHCGRLEGSGYKHGRWLDTVFMQLAMNGGTATPPDPASLPERRFRGR
jgi:phosphinothricin acetyltransferase